ncbi:MFS transporter [Polaribacter sp.]|nr:MFS transporter [Polaribacter sp.]
MVKKVISVYLSGFLVGIALVLFPAAGNIFVDSEYHGLSSGQFGSIFIPQIVLAIIASLSAPKLADKIGMKKVMMYGLVALLLSMLSLAASNWFMKGELDYWIIMLATAFMGIGFGFTITALNPFAYSLFPGKETSAVTAMHIMLGLGTASSALLLNLFYNNDIWWAAPTLIAILIALIFVLILATSLTIPKQENEEENETKKGVPIRIWLFALGVFLYGACEATFGNFGAVFLEKEGELSVTKASLGLSLFWGGITVGRVLFTLIAMRFKTKWLYMIAPFIVSIVFFLLPIAKSEFTLLACMFLGGLACSFLFPKSISTATDEFPKYAALASGAMVAALQLGTGFSSNVIGYFNSSYSLATLFQFSAFYALGMGILVTFLMLKQK